MDQLIVTVAIDHRDQIMAAPERRRWWVDCARLGATTGDGRGISYDCTFVDSGPVPLLISGQRVGQVLFAGVLNTPRWDAIVDTPGWRTIVMAGTVDAPDALQVLSGRCAEMDLGAEGTFFELDQSDHILWFRSVQFAALTAGRLPVFGSSGFITGSPLDICSDGMPSWLGA